MDAFLIPGGFGTRQETHNGRLHEFIRALPEKTLLTSVCTGSRIYGAMGLLDGKPATNRKEPGPARGLEFRQGADRPAGGIAPRPASHRARWSMPGGSSPRGGIASGMEMGFNLLRRAGYDETLIGEVARVMEYKRRYDLEPQRCRICR